MLKMSNGFLAVGSNSTTDLMILLAKMRCNHFVHTSALLNIFQSQQCHFLFLYRDSQATAQSKELKAKTGKSR
jgi:hypothetical protein